MLVVVFAIVGELYTERGSLLSTAIFVYAATAPINGYFGGSLYARYSKEIGTTVHTIRLDPGSIRF